VIMIMTVKKTLLEIYVGRLDRWEESERRNLQDSIDRRKWRVRHQLKLWTLMHVALWGIVASGIGGSVVACVVGDIVWLGAPVIICMCAAGGLNLLLNRREGRR